MSCKSLCTLILSFDTVFWCTLIPLYFNIVTQKKNWFRSQSPLLLIMPELGTRTFFVWSWKFPQTSASAFRFFKISMNFSFTLQIHQGSIGSKIIDLFLTHNSHRLAVHNFSPIWPQFTIKSHSDTSKKPELEHQHSGSFITEECPKNSYEKQSDESQNLKIQNMLLQYAHEERS